MNTRHALAVLGALVLGTAFGIAFLLEDLARINDCRLPVSVAPLDHVTVCFDVVDNVVTGAPSLRTRSLAPTRTGVAPCVAARLRNSAEIYVRWSVRNEVGHALTYHSATSLVGRLGQRWARATRRSEICSTHPATVLSSPP